MAELRLERASFFEDCWNTAKLYLLKQGSLPAIELCCERSALLGGGRSVQLIDDP